MAYWQELLEELVSTRRPALVGYAYVFTGDISDAEDLVHDAILRTFGKPRGIKDVAHAEAYTRRAIATQFLNRRRRHKRFLEKVHLFVNEQEEPDHGAQLDATQSVQAALTSLSPRERTCVVLRFFEHMTVPEIAATLGLAEGSVKRYLADGVKRLGGLLEAPVEEEEAIRVSVVPITQRRSR